MERTDRRTYNTELTVALRNYANAPKNTVTYQVGYTWTKQFKMAHEYSQLYKEQTQNYLLCTPFKK
jgi:hypothetical protein